MATGGATSTSMLALARWNAERSCAFGGKVTRLDFFHSSNRLLERVSLAYVPVGVERRDHYGYRWGHDNLHCWH